MEGIKLLHHLVNLTFNLSPKDLFGDITLSIMTLSIMILSIITLNIMILSIKTLSIITFSRMTARIMPKCISV